eukprot:1117640-Pelagomonas_calceolata.AAC.14
MSAHIVREAAGPEPCQDRKKEGKGHIAVPAYVGSFAVRIESHPASCLRCLLGLSGRNLLRCRCVLCAPWGNFHQKVQERCPDVRVVVRRTGTSVMVLSQDRDRGRVTLSTKKLEPTPGDMLRDPQRVFENADLMAETFRKRVEAAELSARSDPNSLNPMAAVLDPSEMNPMFSSVDYQQADPAAGENYTY